MALPGQSAFAAPAPALAPPTSAPSFGDALSAFEDHVVGAPEDVWHIQAGETDLEAIYAADEIVVNHDVEDHAEFTEVMVDHDAYDSAETIMEHDVVSAPDERPDLHPARAVALPPDTDPFVAELVQLGFDAFRQGQPEAAAQAFARLAEVRPQWAAAHANRGVALMQQAATEGGVDISLGLDVEGRWVEAVMALQQAVRLEPANGDILFDLAVALFHAGHMETAEQVSLAALQLAPNDPACLNVRAAVQLGQTQFDAALTSLRQAASLAPQDAIITTNLRRLVPA